LSGKFADERRGARNDAAQGRAVNFRRAGEFADERGGISAKPFARRNVHLPQHAPVVGHADVRVSVANVKKQNHKQFQGGKRKSGKAETTSAKLVSPFPLFSLPLFIFVSFISPASRRRR
jgi:hypothetical protein